MFRGVVAVVTGGASGIGAALADQLEARGAAVTVADAAPTRRTHHRVDVSDAGAMARFAADVPDATFVCLNAGVLSTHLGPPWEAPPEEWERVMGVNLSGVVNGLRAFVPQMLAADRPGHILITASLAGIATWPGGGPYAASKHAVVAVAEQARLHLEGTPIDVHLLCPSLVRSGMSTEGADAADVARTALDAVTAGRFTIVEETWAEAVEARGRRLATGAAPAVPQPN